MENKEEAKKIIDKANVVFLATDEGVVLNGNGGDIFCAVFVGIVKLAEECKLDPVAIADDLVRYLANYKEATKDVC